MERLQVSFFEILQQKSFIKPGRGVDRSSGRKQKQIRRSRKGSEEQK
jgi:hypothetical protein